jgi:hypothetical protein
MVGDTEKHLMTVNDDTFYLATTDYSEESSSGFKIDLSNKELKAYEGFSLSATNNASFIQKIEYTGKYLKINNDEDKTYELIEEEDEEILKEEKNFYMTNE